MGTLMDEAKPPGSLGTRAPADDPVSDDPVPDDWVTELTGPERARAVEQLHALLLRAARREAGRRSGQNGVAGGELDDLAQQAADDALVFVLRRVLDFRGGSCFTTWV